MYFGTDQYDLSVKGMMAHPSYLCYAESRDGITWERPELNLVSFQGSTRNNIVLAGDTVRIPGVDKLGVDHFAVFKDPNPGLAPGEEYKMIILGNRALFALGSSDGLRWKPISDKPVITQGYFDSKNLAFWDPVHKIYRAYFRDFRNTVTGAQRSQQQKADPGPPLRARYHDRHLDGLHPLERTAVAALSRSSRRGALHQSGRAVLPRAPYPYGFPDALPGSRLVGSHAVAAERRASGSSLEGVAALSAPPLPTRSS